MERKEDGQALPGVVLEERLHEVMRRTHHNMVCTIADRPQKKIKNSIIGMLQDSMTRYVPQFEQNRPFWVYI